MSLLFCLQLSPIDANDAVDLARLIADLARKFPPPDPPDWLISFRKDTPLIRVETIKSALGGEFPTIFTARAERYANGWPAGSNAQWASAMEDVLRLLNDGHTDAEGVLTFEPDCVPLTTNWIERLQTAYGARTKPIVGCMGPVGPWPDSNHVNGNAMWPATLARDWPQVLKTPVDQAWDFHHREFFVPQAEDTALIVQYYRRKSFTAEEWTGVEKAGRRPALLHGVKDASARILAREHLLRGRTINLPRRMHA